ncbi:MAG: Do family serine endopeptidase [Deltaproteobacteria bacterium]|nr:Do family serine endopeptidase [Deltaproteobacteria bacterium]
MTKRKYFLSVYFLSGIFLFLTIITPCLCFGQSYERKTPVVNAVEKVSPAVVNISVEYSVKARPNPFGGFGGFDTLFDNFFKDFFEPGFDKNLKRNSVGSGVIIDGKRGYILTNAHVISKTSNIKVILKDKYEFQARVIGIDPDSDIAVLHIESKDTLPSVKMGTSDNLMIGETVIAIGNPFGFSHTVTTGVISALKRSIKTDNQVFNNFIQTDASINPGNSGGPLLNINGELIGINTAVYAKAQGIGFAIPINTAKRIISDLILHGEVIPAWTGIIVQDIDFETAQYFGISKNDGVLIKAVEKKSPAFKTGIKEGDIIKKIGGNSVSSIVDYTSFIKEYSAGDNIKLEILRNKKIKTIFVKTKIFPKNLAPELSVSLFGIKTANKNNAKGVEIVKINPNCHLAKIGAKPGDVIRQINEDAINNKKDFYKAVIKYRTKDTAVILIQRDRQFYYVTVKLAR